MAQSTVLAAGATAARSSDIVVTSTPVTVSLFGAAGGAFAVGSQAYLERKIGSNWQPVYDEHGPVYLGTGRMDVVIVGPGTYSVYRVAGASFGVALDTTA